MGEACDNILPMPRRLNPRQIIAIEMDLSTNFSPEQIAHRCGIKVETLRKWQKLPEYKAEYDAKYQRIMNRMAELMKPHEQRFDEHIEKVLELQGDIIAKAKEKIQDEECSMRDAKDAMAIVEGVYAHDPRRRYTKTTRQENKTTHEHIIGQKELQMINAEGDKMRHLLPHLRANEAIPVDAYEIPEEGEDDDGETAD